MKTLIKAGGDVADKVLDKGADVATAMMNHTSGLISKLSDDIGAMADRIVETENKIGAMADRIVKTEELMAKLTATLAGKKLDLSDHTLTGERASQTVVLSTKVAEVRGDTGPELTIAGDPAKYLLYVSNSPLFQDGSTVVSKVNNAGDYATAWKRSIIALRQLGSATKNAKPKATVVSIAVRAIGKEDQPSLLSNSIDVRVRK